MRNKPPPPTSPVPLENVEQSSSDEVLANAPTKLQCQIIAAIAFNPSPHCPRPVHAGPANLFNLQQRGGGGSGGQNWDNFAINLSVQLKAVLYEDLH